jgi:hypothetical protein
MVLVDLISFIPLACAEWDDSLPFSGASSIPLCYILFPATLLHQLFFHPTSLPLAIYFLVYRVDSKFIYNRLLGILFSSCTFVYAYFFIAISVPFSVFCVLFVCKCVLYCTVPCCAMLCYTLLLPLGVSTIAAKYMYIYEGGTQKKLELFSGGQARCSTCFRC